MALLLKAASAVCRASMHAVSPAGTHWCGYATRTARPVEKVGIPNVQHIFAVASGKGGVGKSSTAVNLAVALAAQPGRRVGLLDADVFGPSIPRMMNLSGRPEADPENKMIPLRSNNVHCMSMGFLLPEDAPAVWRGPMVMSAIDTFIQKVNWGQLDVLVIDMPPGTGDAQISITQRLQLSGAVIVSTPQDVALIDARRGINMFRKVSVPILGVVENMSYFQCPACGHREHIFGDSGAARMAQELGVQLLGQIPLQTAIRETSDAGAPIVASSPSAPAAKAYTEIAEKIAAMLHAPGGGSRKEAPTIVMR